MNQKLNESNNDFEWIVFCVGGGAPTVAHDTEENAKQEAARLLKLEPSPSLSIFNLFMYFLFLGLHNRRYAPLDSRDIETFARL